MRADRHPPLSSLFVGLLGLSLLPVGWAVPSSTVSRPQDCSLHAHHPALQHHNRAALSAIWGSLKESIQHWFSSTDEGSEHYHHSATHGAGPIFAQYGDQMVLRFNISTAKEAASLAEAADILFLDVWQSLGSWVDIRIAGNVIPSLLGLLPHTLQHAHVPLMTSNELVRAIADTYPSSSAQSGSVSESQRASRSFTSTDSNTHGSSADMFFDDYRPLSVITHWMRLLQSLFVTHVRVISVGRSSEGRDIWALKIGLRPANAEDPLEPRKTIIVSGGSHSREWISTSTVNYIAHSLVTQYGRNPDVTKLLEDFDWILIPTLNPDGYVYSWDNDRLWRKNRQSTSLRFCRGLDLDRTYGFKWDGDHTAGNPCSESFAGAGPFEASESKTFSTWALNETKSNNVTFVGLLDLHSYSEQILYPYSFSCREEPPNVEDLAELGQGLAKAIRIDGHENYRVISACEGNVAISGHTLPKVSGGGGSLLDWFYHEMGVKHAFQIKLRDKGSYGFLLPKNYIVPTGAEGLSAVGFFGKALSTLYFAQKEAPSPDQQVQQPLL